MKNINTTSTLLSTLAIVAAVIGLAGSASASEEVTEAAATSADSDAGGGAAGGTAEEAEYRAKVTDERQWIADALEDRAKKEESEIATQQHGPLCG